MYISIIDLFTLGHSRTNLTIEKQLILLEKGKKDQQHPNK